jgi:hypothetical protein
MPQPDLISSSEMVRGGEAYKAFWFMKDTEMIPNIFGGPAGQG